MASPVGPPDPRGGEMRRPSWLQRIATIPVVVGALAAIGPIATAGAQEPKLPVVFVHGGSGSASQYEVQAQRWASNDYPYEVRAIDRAAGVPFNEAFDEFVDDVLAETGEEKIYMVAHSIGVPIASGYLNSSPERAARVAKYIGIDGAGSTPDSCPGGVDENGDWNVPCAGVFGRGNPNRGFGPDHNVHFPNQGHTEVVGSPESFAAQYEWFTGDEPKTTDVLPEPPGEVTIAGRALSFPANTALVGSTVELFEVHPDTGVRNSSDPEATFTIDQTGDFGPVEVNGSRPYEMTLTNTEGFTQHFY